MLFRRLLAGFWFLQRCTLSNSVNANYSNNRCCCFFRSFLACDAVVTKPWFSKECLLCKFLTFPSCVVHSLSRSQQQRHLQSSYEYIGCFADRWWDGESWQSRPLEDGSKAYHMTPEVRTEILLLIHALLPCAEEEILFVLLIMEVFTMGSTHSLKATAVLVHTSEYEGIVEQPSPDKPDINNISTNTPPPFFTVLII